MILIFDLDDTLYPEHTFVESGFRAVADMLAEEHAWDKNEIFSQMLLIWKKFGRGAIFDELLSCRGSFSNKEVYRCLQVYRRHSPEISLYPSARDILKKFSVYPLYVVTDGHKNVQANKAAALGLDGYVKKVFITHRYGVINAKPSTYCFDLIRNIEKVKWTDLVYVGDNPSKDFVNLNPLGVLTVRVLTGEYGSKVAEQGYDAAITIPTIADLPNVIGFDLK